ncbi:glycoside hydrolase family protein [Enterobacter kobei]|uniref:glycoside hydrolase family protein n=1 Tax=Enterobacter kobei TaxID=208224 RepID=UPI003F41FBC4
MSNKAKLSAAVLALIASGASAPLIFDQFISEKEGNALVAVVDPGGVWSLCHGVTVIDGRRVVKGMTATEEQCRKVNAIERDKALAWVDRNIKVPLTEPQKVGIASFCPYNIGPGKCFPSTFYKRINSGDLRRIDAIKALQKLNLIDADADPDTVLSELLAESASLSEPPPGV